MMYETFHIFREDRQQGDKKVFNSTGTIEEGDIIRCVDTGLLFKIYCLYKPILGYTVEDGKGGDTLACDENKAATWHKCQSARYFGGPRVHEGIFSVEDKFVALLWNAKLGVVFKTFNPAKVGSSLINFGKKVPPELEVNSTGLFSDEVRVEIFAKLICYSPSLLRIEGISLYYTR
eukprot:3579006-Pleurochrysis_carterae.AAC.1